MDQSTAVRAIAQELNAGDRSGRNTRLARLMGASVATIRSWGASRSSKKGFSRDTEGCFEAGRRSGRSREEQEAQLRRPERPLDGDVFQPVKLRHSTLP